MGKIERAIGAEPAEEIGGGRAICFRRKRLPCQWSVHRTERLEAACEDDGFGRKMRELFGAYGDGVGKPLVDGFL